MTREEERAAWRPSQQQPNEHCYAREHADHNSHMFLWDDHVCHQALVELEHAEREANIAAWAAYYDSVEVA